MTDAVHQLPAFEPFEVRRPKTVREIMLRLVRLPLALFFLLASLALVVGLTLRRQQAPELMTVLMTVLLAVFFLTVTASLCVSSVRRLVYWRVDQAGIHQRCLGMAGWNLPWSEIVARALGPAGSPWILLVVIPVAGGPYQALVLVDRAGRRRKVNRLGTNGDRLDAIVRFYLDPAEELRRAELSRQALQTAQATYSHHTTDPAPLHRVTSDSSTVRMKINEPKFLNVCCNCLGPAAYIARIMMAQGLWGLLASRSERLPVPLCATCYARIKPSGLGQLWGPGGMIVIVVGVLTFMLACMSQSWMGLVPALFGLAGVFAGWRMGRRYVNRPSPDELIRVVQFNRKQGWMDLRFANPEYARLTADMNPSPPQKKEPGLSE
jgi:hypothetical protein